MTVHKLKILLSGAAFALLLCSCGNKGDLYLPDQDTNTYANANESGTQ